MTGCRSTRPFSGPARSAAARGASAVIGVAALAWLATLPFATASAQAATTVLYDGALGSLPTAQGWALCSLDPAGTAFCGSTVVGATQSMVGDGVVLNTDGAFGNSVYAGYARLQSLDTSAPGIRLSFDLRVQFEGHASTDRAGFSVIALGPGSTGIEIGFWENEVWAQNTGFTHGESAAFDTKAEVTRYDLVLANGQYSLKATGSGGTVSLLSGNLRNYGTQLPYNLSNWVFFGDNTSRGASTSRIEYIALTPVPEPHTWATLVAGLGVVGIAVRRRARRARR